MNQPQRILFSFLLTTLVLSFSSKLENHLVDTAEMVQYVPTSQKLIALTFDDGPLSLTTPDILATLRQKNVRATFFVVGERVEKFPTLLQQEVADGHEIGTHTYSHPELYRLPAHRVKEELAAAEATITLYAPKPTLFRPPMGKYSPAVLTLAREYGYTIILWTIDTDDWQPHAPSDIKKVVLKRIKPGSIILLHDGIYPSGTPQALGEIIDCLREQGYEFVTISELLRHYHP